jgi:hypothetical protein
MIHNPLETAVERDVLLPLHYAGLTDAARIRIENGPFERHTLDRQSRALVRVKIPAQSRTWLVVQAP